MDYGPLERNRDKNKKILLKLFPKARRKAGLRGEYRDIA